MPRPPLRVLLALLLATTLARAEDATPSPSPAEASAPAPAATADAVPGAMGPAGLPEGEFPPRLFLAKQDGVPVRSDAGFVYREVNHLARGAQVLVDGRKGPWLHVRPEGWVLAEHVEEPSLAAPDEITIVVLKEGARVRSGPATDQPQVRTLPKGAEVKATSLENGWWKLADGGWLFKDLAEAKAPQAGSPTPTAEGKTGAVIASTQEFGKADADVRWSLMDMHGIVFEVSPIAPRSPFLAMLKNEMKATGLMETDWTYMRIAISVPPGPYRFNYSPEGNATLLIDGNGERYGSVYMRGPVERLPKNLRDLFTATSVGQGQTWAGILLFRPTLDPFKVRDGFIFVGGRLQRMYRSD